MLLLLVTAGVPVAEQRREQLKLLYTLGVTRAESLRMLSLEFGLLGMIAALLGLVGAVLLSAIVLVYVFRLDFSLNPVIIGLWAFGLPLLTAVVGRFIFRGMT